MKITVKEIKVEEKISARTNKPYYLQKMKVELNDEIRNLNVFVESPSKAYAVGVYNVSAESFKVNDFGSLEIGFLKLVKAA